MGIEDCVYVKKRETPRVSKACRSCRLVRTDAEIL